jgi:tripeptidyl-peptidase-1
MTSRLVVHLFVCASCAGTVLAVESQEYELVAHLQHRNLDRLQQLFWEIADPSHPRYLRHLTLDETAALIGASDQSIEEATAWLMSLGAQTSSIRVSNLRDSVSVTFSADNRTMVASSQEAKSFLTAVSRGKPACVLFVVRRDSRQEPTLKWRDDRAKQAPASSVGASYTVPNIKASYGIPTDYQAKNATTLQMVWGPGTFGYSTQQLKRFKYAQCPLLHTEKVLFDTDNHGEEGGDNYMEGNLDTQMISAFGLNITTLVSNTNTSASTEEGDGFGQAMLDFATTLQQRSVLPHVLSLSLGSLDAASCDLLCSKAEDRGVSQAECRSYLQEQRQVCMFLSQAQEDRINTAWQILGVRGVSIFGSSGDGGSHFSFQPFRGGSIADTLNSISCEYQMPVFPSSSPYITSVGGTQWKRRDPSKPTTWTGSGGGFSRQFDMPAFQAKAVAQYLNSTDNLPPQSSFIQTNRAYPDISAIGVMGTSMSCPILAGIFSMIMDHRLSNGLPPLGYVAPRIWEVAQSFPGEALRDVPEGNSKTDCDSGFPSRAKFWDPNTGWGEPIWAGMLKHFGEDTLLVPSAVARAHAASSVTLVI